MMETSGNPIMVGDGGFGLNSGFGILAIIIIAMMFLKGGFFGGNQNGGDNTAAILTALGAGNNRGYQPQYATQQDVQYTSQFGQLLDGNRDIIGTVTNGTAQTIAASTQNAANAINAIKDGNANVIREFGNVETALATLSGRQQECCCETKMMLAETGAGINAGIAQNRYEAALGISGINQNIAQNRYEAAMNTAAIQKTIVDEAQKNRDFMQKTNDLITGNRMADMQNRINRLELNEALYGVPRYQPNYTYGAVPSPYGGMPVPPPYPYTPAA